MGIEIQSHEIIWSIINFLVLVAILNKFLYKPLLGMLEKRKEDIANRYEEAEAAKSEAQRLKEQYTEEMQNAKREAQEIITKASKLAEDTRAEMLRESREESVKIMKKAQEEIRLEKEKAKAELREEISGLAVMAAGKVLNRTLRPEDHEKMIREFVNEVGDAS